MTTAGVTRGAPFTESIKYSTQDFINEQDFQSNFYLHNELNSNKC